MVHNALWLILNDPSAFPGTVADFDVFPVMGSQEFVESAEQRKLLPVVSSVTAAPEERWPTFPRMGLVFISDLIVFEYPPKAILESAQFSGSIDLVSFYPECPGANSKHPFVLKMTDQGSDGVGRQAHIVIDQENDTMAGGCKAAVGGEDEASVVIPLQKLYQGIPAVFFLEPFDTVIRASIIHNNDLGLLSGLFFIPAGSNQCRGKKPLKQFPSIPVRYDNADVVHMEDKKEFGILDGPLIREGHCFVKTELC